MKLMTPRERILTATRKQQADKLPFLHWWRYSTTSWAERVCRNNGMGMAWIRPPYTAKMNGVIMSEEQIASGGLRRTYSTPVGSVYLEEKRDPGAGQWHQMRSWQGVIPWQVERLIKGPDDYKIVKFMVENTEYLPDYFPIEQAKNWLGEDGVVVARIQRTPIQTLLLDWIGTEQSGRFYIHHAKYPDLIDDLCQSLSKSLERLYEIVAHSPVDIVYCGDNIDGLLVNPRLFEKYLIPQYQKMGGILHEHGKLLAVHMDGRLAVLKDLIAQTPIDIIEAMHPPPMGDLPLAEALSVWKDKVIWVGFPGSIYTLGPEATKQYTLDLLKQAGSGNRLVIETSTENLISNDNLLTLASVLEKSCLPLSQNQIEEIEQAIG